MSQHVCKSIKREKLGHSIYQEESKKYYDDLHGLYTHVFLNPERIKAEKTEQRYHFGNVPGIRNLYTFINILAEFLKNKKNIKGIDYSCASHFFVNDTVCDFKWDVTGYDMDLNAIHDAWKRYPKSRDHYQYWNLLEKDIPVADGSQNFVFCNALIQHFDTQEVCAAFRDISRVLCKEGIFTLIFKRKVGDWKRFSTKSGLHVHVLDEKEGCVKIEDILMRDALQSLPPQEKGKIDTSYHTGLRLFHVFSVDQIIQIAKENRLHVCENVVLQKQKMEQAIFTYNSGKGIPTAAIFFRKE